MLDYNVDLMSNEDLLEAADKIFTTQEKDFEKIKNEKWYKKLFHAITLNRDGKKYVVRGISSLAKLQQLFIGIYVKNYKKTHEQLDEVIERVTKNSDVIKKIYGMFVLQFDEQKGLETLTSQDKEILAVFLGEYRDENGSVPKKVQEYNRGVLSALNVKVPAGNLGNHQIRKLEAPKVVYRCFMEQCAVDGTIDTQEWTDKIYEDLKDFEISENTKAEIKKAVKNEVEIGGIEYLIIKYSKDNAGILDTDFEVDLEGSVNSDQDSTDRYETTDEREIENMEEMSDEIIKSILQIRSGETKLFTNKNIHISAYINCEGSLEIDHCVLYYNESEAGDEITLAKGARLHISNSLVICKGYDENFFITCNEDTSISFENSTFVDCSYMLKAKDGANIIINKCELKNCYEKFIDVYLKTDNTCNISGNLITENDLSTFNQKKDKDFRDVEMMIISSSHDKQTIICENTINEDDSIKVAGITDERLNRICYFNAPGAVISNCTFIGLTEAVRAAEIRECKFVNCLEAIMIYRFRDKESIVDNCIFEKCTEVITLYTNTKVSNCQFISCYNRLINAPYYSGGNNRIEFCQFINTCNNLDDSKASNCLYGTSCITLRRGKESDASVNCIKKCIFDGVNMEDNFLIAAYGSEKPSGTVINIEDCDFKNCNTKRWSGKIIKEYIQYDTFFKKNQDYHANIITNCRGLDRINKDKSEVTNISIRTIATTGNTIGSTVPAVLRAGSGVKMFTYAAIGGPVGLLLAARKKLKR